MADDAIPQDDPRPLSEEERLRRASDWSDYRKDYGVSPVDDTRHREHAAFTMGWQIAWVAREAETERARATAVRLEQELAESAARVVRLCAQIADQVVEEQAEPYGESGAKDVAAAIRAGFGLIAEPPVKLDPVPLVVSSGRRYSLDVEDLLANPTFDPRPEYSQDPRDYGIGGAQ